MLHGYAGVSHQLDDVAPLNTWVGLAELPLIEINPDPSWGQLQRPFAGGSVAESCADHNSEIGPCKERLNGGLCPKVTKRQIVVLRDHPFAFDAGEDRGVK